MTTRNRELAGIIDDSGNITAGGNLTVSGTTLTSSSTVETHADPLIELNTGAGSNSNDLGFVFERGSTGDNACIIWDESNDGFAVGTTTATGTSTGNMTFTAADFAAGKVTVDNVLINGTTIGHTSDTDLLTLADGLLTVAGEISVTTLDIGGTNVTATAAELNILDGVNSTAAELNILDGVTATAAEINFLDGDTSATGTTLASADRVIVNDGGTMKQVALSDFETFFESEIDTFSTIDINGGTIDGATVGANSASSGAFTTLSASGALTGTLGTAAQGNVTSLGTLTALTVDNLGINGNTITANSGALNLTPASGSAIVLDGTISVDAGVVTGATSITSTAFVGNITGNVTGNTSGTAATVTTAAQTNITSLGTLTGLTVQKASSGASATSGTVVTIEDDDNTELSLLGGSSSLLAINFGHSGDNDEGKITFNTTAGSEDLQIVSSKEITLDAAGDIILDAGGQNWYFDDDGTRVFSIAQVSSDVYIGTEVADKDMIFRVNDSDGGGVITALTIDASAYGQLLAVANTPSNPTYSFGNDTNTGLTRPTGDTLTLVTGGTERVRISSAGAVGIARTASQSNTKLEVGGADNVPLIAAEASGVFAGLGTVSAVSGTGLYVGTTLKFAVASTGAIGINGANYGTDGQIFTSGGAGAAAAWEDAPSSGIGIGKAIVMAMVFGG